MADSDNGDLDPRQNETEHDDVDDEPLLSFDFDEEPMPHWSEPGSGEKPDGGERPDPPEIDATTLGRSRLFPQLPDDPHLVDTSDTGLMDAVRSDTVPTVSPGTEEELFDTGPLSVEDSTQTIGQTSDTSHASSTDEFFQDEVSTDELFGESLFEDEEVFDEELFDDAPIIGAAEGDGGPVFDTGPIHEVEVEERDEDRSDEAVGVEKDAAPDKDLEIEEEAFEIADPPAEANSLSRTEDSNELSELVGEPTAELVLDEQTPQLTQEDVEQQAVGVESDSDLASSPEQERLEQEVKPSPRVIELFDTPPSQRIMASADEPQSEPNEQRRDRDGGDWKDFGGPAPHWREGRQEL